MKPRLLWYFLFLALVVMVDQTQGWWGGESRRRSCTRTNCAVGSWSAWSSCTQPCGIGGIQRRSRTKTRGESCGGSCPYPFTETVSCNKGCSNGGTPLHGRCINCKTGYSGKCCTGVDGGWSAWTTWQNCSKVCGTGQQERRRGCTAPLPRNGGRLCVGASRLDRACNTHNCPVHGGWSRWRGWTNCSQSCGTGSQERSRTCTNPLPRYGGNSCRGAALDKQTCNKQPCPVDGGWSSWDVWTSCSRRCDTGTQGKSRNCTKPLPRNGGKSCPGAANEQRVCNTHSCPVHGGWSNWSVSTPCSVTCGSGVEILSRTCTNPAPKRGGIACTGAPQKEQAYTKKPCPIHGGWSTWSVSTPCSVTCDSGVEILSRTCTNPAPKHGGTACKGAPRKQQACTKNSCPIHGGWSNWSVSTPCSVTCGSGVEILSRTCTNPAPKRGGTACTGAPQKEQACTKKPCPIHGVDGGWSSWSVLTPCSVTCGNGIEILSRTCTNPAAKHGGTSCTGAPRKEQACTKNPCSIDGGWSSWSTWTTCSQSCGRGFQERSRSCTHPAPSNGGKTCQGAARESHGCNTQSCPVHGGWSKWGNWAECSVTCGAGVMSRERHCDNPVPAYGGRRCEGSNNDSKSCSTDVCIAGVGCYESFPTDRLGSFTDEIDWFAHFSSQMQRIVKKCAHLAVKKGQIFFAVEDFGNCYGAQVSPFGSASKATQCNFGVGLKNYYYVYEISS
ncbi:hypothetical protein OS493_032204 [Desmophyllum pertusum]|uniref:Hemicentin-1 n=1 Tax=Desmophyllum pertusum TaxID=174260 RepID=A0A9W9ZWU2_9CNID|nr:hypothetical protein OS493_032204 [Desmophyllum pertusum]